MYYQWMICEDFKLKIREGYVKLGELETLNTWNEKKMNLWFPQVTLSSHKMDLHIC